MYCRRKPSTGDSESMRVLVTGGAGYIGSHTCVGPLEAGHDITVIDNLCNSSEIALERVQEITGKPLTFVRGDIRNPTGDVAELWANPGHARRVLGWIASRDVADMCRDAWRWQSVNPDGFKW